MRMSEEYVQRTFFSLKSWNDLYDFVDSLDSSNPFQSALKYYARTWHAPDSEAEFEPAEFVSEDLAATYLHQCPVIFEGSNKWAEKCYLPRIEHEQKLNSLYARCEVLRKLHPNTSICLIIVPEKDLLISRSFMKERRFDPIVETVQDLRRRLRALDIPLIFEQPTQLLHEHMSIDDFQYPDSHLHPRNYIVIFSHALRSIGVDWEVVSPSVTMKQLPVYCDLSTKFKGGRDVPVNSFEIDFLGSDLEQVHGSKTFESPLGKTQQVFGNLSPVIPQDVLILGDSHSSILQQRRLTYLFANTFSRTQFCWNPSGVQSIAEPLSAQNVVLEVSLRFVL